MNLSDFELLPGVVQSTNDPECKGRIKCIVPGIFDPETMPDEMLPWVYPIGMNRYQMFSKLMKGSKVWVLNNTLNKFEFWYFPMFDYHTPLTENYLKENYNNDPEVIISRDGGGPSALMTYDDTNGYNIKLNNDYIKILPSEQIKLKAADGTIKINGSKIYTGNDSEQYQPTVLGNTLVQLLKDLQGVFGDLKEKAGSFPDTAHLVDGFASGEEILGIANEILTKNTLVN